MDTSNQLEVTLISRSFYFMQDVYLAKGIKQVFNLDAQTDNFKKAISINSAIGVLLTEPKYPEIVESIKDEKLKRATKIALNIAVDEFVDVVEAKVEVLEVETVIEDVIEDVVEDVIEPEVKIEVEDEVVYLIGDKPAKDLLAGSSRKVVKVLQSLVDLTDEDKAELLKLEEANKNRAQVKTVLEG